MENRISIPHDLRRQLRNYGLNPTDLVIYITSSCNLRCKHCYVGNGMLSQNWIYSADDVNNYINQFDYLDRVNIIGGEPLLHPGINSIIANLIKANVAEIRLATNLTSLDYFEYASHHCDHLTISVGLDGPNPQVHNYIRGKGAFESTMNNLKTVIAAGYDVEITASIMTHNIHLFDEFVSLCRSLNIKKLNLHKMSLHGNALNNQALYVSPSEWANFCKDVERRAVAEKEADSVRVRYPLLFTTQEHFDYLVSEGLYHHLVDKSFYSIDGGQRIVLYSDGRLFISSEAYGTEAYVGYLQNGRFVYNEKSDNELNIFRNNRNATVTNIYPLQSGDADYPIVLSVSFKNNVYI